MAFGTKYTLTFYDFYQRKWTLNLKKDGYSSTIYTLEGGGTPVILSDPNQGSGKLIPIRGTEMKIQLYIDLASLNYDFKDDFWDISDREWLAELNQETESGYKKLLSITNLNLSVVSFPAHILNIPIDSVATEAYKQRPSCDFSLGNMNVYGDLYNLVTLRLWAIPKSEGINSNQRILLFSQALNYLTHPTIENVIDLLATDSNISKVSATTIKLTISATVLDNNPVSSLNIDNSWNIEADYYSTTLGDNTRFLPRVSTIGGPPYSNYDKSFIGGVIKNSIKLFLISYNPSGSPDKTLIAQYDYQVSETAISVANAFGAAILNSELINNIILDPYSTYLLTDLKLSGASDGDGTFNIAISPPAGTAGNGFVLTDGTINVPANNNDTYLFLDFTNTAYDIDITGKDTFAGGSDSGDSFVIQIFKSPDTTTIASTIALNPIGGIGADTIASIMDRLNDQLQYQGSFIKSELDAQNRIVLTSEHPDISNYTIRFTTSGGSTTDPSVYESFDGGTYNILYFLGWILPGLYKQPHQNGKELIELSATCGLGDLRNIEFTVNDARPFEMLSFMEIIRQCLRNVGYSLNIVESFNLYPNIEGIETNTDDSGLLQAYQDSSRLNGRNCYEVLEEIITIIKGSICQYFGEWVIIPKDLQNDSYIEKLYDQFGNYVEQRTRQSTNFIKDVGGTTRDNIYINRTGNIIFEPAFRSVIFRENYGLVPQLIKFPNFSSINEQLGNLKYPWTWRSNDGTYNVNVNGAISLSDKVLQIEKSVNEYILQQEFIISDIEVSDPDDNQYELSFKYKTLDNDYSAAEIDLKIIATDGTLTAYLTNDNNNGIWSVSDSLITLNAVGNNDEKTLNLKFDYPGTFTESEAIVTFRIYQQTDGYMQIISVVLNANIKIIGGAKKTHYYDEQIDIITSKNFNEDFNLMDVPNVPGAKKFYKNALFGFDSDNNDYILISSWDYATPSDERQLLSHLRKFYLKEYARSIKLITAEVLGQLDLRTILKDKTITGDPLFMLTGGDLDVKRCILSGEWEEYDIDDSGFTRIEKTESFDEENAGTNAYTTSSGDSGSSGTQTNVDLSDYVQNDDLDNAIIGNEGTFIGSDLDVNKQITIYHNLGRKNVILFLQDKDGKMINQSNYEMDSENSINYVILTLWYPVGASDTVYYRFL